MNLRKIKSLSIVVAFALPATTLIPFGSAIAAIAWSTKAPIPTPRVGAAAAEVNGKIYVIGGYGGGQVTGTVEEYDPATNTWTTKTPMPTPRYAVVATVNGKIYAIGSQHYWPYNNPVEEYDPVADTWIARAPMPTVRFRLGTAVVNGKIYAIGGEDPRTGSSVGTVEEYNPTTDTWTTRASMPTPRYDLGVIAVNGKIYAIGGAYPYLNTVEEYDPVADTWTAKAPMIDGRYQHSVVTVSGKVYAIGGLTLNGAFSAETYDPVTNTWSPETPPSTPRYAAAAAAINNKIYITGGWPYNGNDPVAVTEEGIVGVDNIAPTSAALVSGTLALGTTTCVSLSSTGEQGNGYGSWNTINADGRYVAFMSYASNLVPDDTNSNGDIFVRDRLLSTTTRVSVSSTGVQANGYSGRPAISADGRYVAFWSAASNLVPDDTNSADDIFVHDRLLSTTTRVSVSSTGVQANGYSGYPVISADGRYVAFSSHANNLVDGDTNAIDDIFVRDLQAGTTRRVSISSTGEQGNGNSIWHAISADGRYVAFSSDANNLVDGDTNAASDIFVHDVQAGATKRVSVLSTGEQTNGYSSNPSISADGSYVAFSSDATNLVDGDTNSNGDIFVRDRLLSTTTRVSVSSTGVQANGYSGRPAISADGR
ncbi:MAG: hypothetical protein M1548_06200, partial [Actinobacteria bacterium]|nr:hypothetical protein [Actinomycetota bacterium]